MLITPKKSQSQSATIFLRKRLLCQPNHIADVLVHRTEHFSIASKRRKVLLGGKEVAMRNILGAKMATIHALAPHQ